MSENKDYVSRSDELGNIHISEEVLAAIAAAAALEGCGHAGPRRGCRHGQGKVVHLVAGVKRVRNHIIGQFFFSGQAVDHRLGKHVFGAVW